MILLLISAHQLKFFGGRNRLCFDNEEETFGAAGSDLESEQQKVVFCVFKKKKRRCRAARFHKSKVRV